MAHFNFVVDTEEMADAVRDVSPHVDGATAAVIAMQASVIAAERRAADSICENVNRGFYTLIRSQISQKIAAIQSQIDARLLEMRDQARKMLDRKKVMERDFQMIAARNMKLFTSLDNALFHRVRELDKPAVDLARQDLRRVQQRYVNSQAALPVHQLESIGAAQVIAASNTKASARGAIHAMEQFVAGSTQQDRLTARILTTEGRNRGVTLFVPLLAAELDSSGGAHSLWRLFVAGQASQQFARAAEQAARKELAADAPSATWAQTSGAQRKAVEDSFRTHVANAAASERAKREMLRLFSASTWLQYGGGNA